jgi:DNA-binding MarR family transcriptional regulator
MAVEGTLDLFKLPEILQLISQQRKTGILTVQGLQDIVAISFLNGRIVAADALNQTLEEGLSQVLLKEGILRAQDLARAASEHQSAGGRLIDLLVERRYIERSQLLEALRLQTFRLLEQLLRWSQGDFKFYSGDEVSYEEGFAPIAVEELLIQAAQHAPEPPRSPAPAAGLRPVSPPAPAARAAENTLLPASRPAPANPRLAVAAPAAPPLIPQVEAEVSGPFRKMRVERRPAVSQVSTPRWLGWVLAVLLAVLVVTALRQAPDSLVLPFPWQEREREGLARDQRAALYLKIDHAAKTWFLLKGSFPDRLQELIAAGLLSPEDREDSEGHRLLYAASEDSYTLDPVERGKPVPGAGATEAITGNFLLDPEFLNVPPEPSVQPLVLLD